MTWLRRVFDWARGRVPDADHIVPERADQARTLAASDAVLEDPRIKRLLSQRDAELRASFERAGHRLGRR